MYATDRTLLLLVTAFAEAGTGLCLLVLPSVLFALLLGSKQPATEALFVGRIAGAALLGIGVASWLARSDKPGPAELGLLIGITIYTVVAAVLLSYAGVALKMAGILLWPAVIFHAVLAAWCVACLRARVTAEWSKS
jgi:hypothetical protein